MVVLVHSSWRGVMKHDYVPRVLKKSASFGFCEARVQQCCSILQPFPSSVHIGGGWRWRCRHGIGNIRLSLPVRGAALVAEGPW